MGMGMEEGREDEDVITGGHPAQVPLEPTFAGGRGYSPCRTMTHPRYTPNGG